MCAHMPVQQTSDVPIVIDVLPPNSAKYAADRGARSHPVTAFRNLQHAVNQCQEVIFFTDPAGVIERVNPAFEKLTGYSSLEAVGKDLSLIAADDPVADSYGRIWEQLFQGRTYRGSLPVRRQQGDICELDVAIAPVRDSKGRIASLVCTGKDTSLQRELETQLSQARGIDAIGTLAGGVVHDFNNMLMVISAYAELALDSLPKEHRLGRHLQEILIASHRASDLTRQLLGFGRKQLHRLHVFSLNSAVEEACRMLPCVIGEDIELRVELGQDLGQVRADSGQIAQVLLNLAINARDAMPNGGKLSIETQLSDGRDNGIAKLSTHPASGYILLTVTDTGQGISDEQLPQIFKPFYTTKPEGAGTGLGLAMVHSIVRQSDGFITAHSQTGKGSTFKIYLPVAAPPVREIPRLHPVEKPVHGGSETLLVVEDEDAVRQSEVEFLSTIGYTVIFAANGKEALDLVRARANMIDLVITDVVMPQMSGPMLAENLASLRPDVKVLFISGHADDTVLQKGVADLAHDFLQKPFPLRSLAGKIREVLEQPIMARAANAAGAQ
jgi:two-component system, cell cycle sensor histidine kinase and response regulator CckA